MSDPCPDCSPGMWHCWRHARELDEARRDLQRRVRRMQQPTDPAALRSFVEEIAGRTCDKPSSGISTRNIAATILCGKCDPCRARRLLGRSHG